MAADGAIELSVIVPALNEELNLAELTSRVLRTFERGGIVGELLLVDDGSTDGTARVIRALQAEHPACVRGVFHLQNRGIAASWRSAAQAARGRLVVTIDADLQYQPEDILRLRRALQEHSVDIVQGFRSAVGRLRDDRYSLSRAFNAVLNGVFAMNLRDNKSGFVLCEREVLLDLLSYDASYFYWQSFIMVAAHAKGYSYREVETLFEKRRQGTSFLAGKGALVASAKSIVDVGKAVWAYRVRRPPPDVARRFLKHDPPAVPAQPARSPAAELRWKTYLATFDSTHWMITRDVEHYYETLQQTQWLEPARIRELQEEKLRRIVRHAYREVPYYRQRMQALRLLPEDIRTLDDLHKLPFLSKDDVRRNLYFDILSESHDRDDILRVTTSGSTGEPFVCYADRAQLELRWAATLRSQEWTGYRFGDPTVRLWHSALGMTPSQVLRERADALLCNRTFIPVFGFSDATLASAVKTLTAERPVLLDGYAEALDLLSRYVASHPELKLAIGAVMSSAQTLPADSRALIERTLGCRVFDKYGSREFSGIAYECDAHDGHHVVAEGFIVEILREGRPAAPGELGEVVVTDLNNTCLPFLRYRIGDLAIAMDPADRCACGRGLPRIGAIEGRVQSIVRGVNGAYLPGSFFAHYLKELDHAIRRYQIVQERPGELLFRVVRGPRCSDDDIAEAVATMRRYLGASMVIEVQTVPSIELLPTGKHNAVLSKIPIDFQSSVAPKASEVVLRRGAATPRPR